MNLAPIVLFVYNRPAHTRRTVETLRENHLATESELIIYSDGPKDISQGALVNEVRNYIKTIDGFKKVEIIEREKNFGLAKSIISGVTDVLSKYPKTIVLEDDLISSDRFLLFVNQALIQYSDDKRIFSVSGYSFPIKIPSTYEYDGYCSYRSMSSSWGTWENRWKHADWEVKDSPDFMKDREKQRSFNRGGDDLSDMLKAQVLRGINSWSIIWDYTHFKNDAFCLCPVISKIFHIGFDGTGVHGDNKLFQQSPLITENVKTFNLPKDAVVESFVHDEFKRLHKYSIKTKIKRIMINYLRKINGKI